MWMILLAAVMADPAGAKGAAAAPQVTLNTSKGEIVVELYPDKAPLTVKNFLAYVNDKFYDGTIFHRVMRDFMIQGGGFTADMNQKATKAPVKNEAGNGVSNARGTIAMARTSAPDSATSQFFINHVDNNGLDRSSPRGDGYGYTVFGKVVKGMEVVDAIAGVRTGMKSGMSDVPVETVTIISAKVTK